MCLFNNFYHYICNHRIFFKFAVNSSNLLSDCMCVFYIEYLIKLGKKLYAIFYLIIYTFLLLVIEK